MADNTEEALLHERAGHTENSLPNAYSQTENNCENGTISAERWNGCGQRHHSLCFRPPLRGGGEIVMEDLKNSDPPEQVTTLWQP